MASNIDIARKFEKACIAKDSTTLKSMLHPKYTFKDPMVQFSSPQEALEMMENCPFECHSENATYVSEGNKVVEIFDSVVTSPISYRMRMCCMSTIEDGKIRSCEMLYDTAQFPKEAMDIIQKTMQGKNKAA